MLLQRGVVIRVGTLHSHTASPFIEPFFVDRWLSGRGLGL